MRLALHALGLSLVLLGVGLWLATGREHVTSLIPAFREISATGWPSVPCFKMNAFWASVNFEVFMSSTPPLQGC